MTKEQEERFEAGIPPRVLLPQLGDFNQDGESKVYRFGYKVLKGDEVFTVVDWGNIKKFIHEVETETTSKLKEEIEKRKTKPPHIGDERLQRNQALQEVLDLINKNTKE